MDAPQETGSLFAVNLAVDHCSRTSHYSFHSCSRFILGGYSAISISKAAPKPVNFQFTADFQALGRFVVLLTAFNGAGHAQRAPP